MNYTDKYLSSLLEINQEALDESIYQKARECVADYIAVTFGGAAVLKREKGKSIEAMFGGNGNAPLVGYDRKDSVLNAALINGITSHVLELDDGHRFGMMHPGACVISALIPVAVSEGTGEKDFLFGVIMGYEAAIRLAAAIQPAHKLKGFHASASCGSVGAAMGICAMLKLSREGTKAALAAALSGAMGLLELIDDDSELKPYNIGKAAMNGVAAVNVAKAGFCAPIDPMGGKRGFFSAVTEPVNPDYLTGIREDMMCIEGIYLKPYAACRHCHSPIEAAINIHNEIGDEEIADACVSTYELAIAGHDHKEISGPNSAKMSIPYSVAVALENGTANEEQFTEEMIGRPQIQKLTDMVKIENDSEMSSWVPDRRAARVEVTTKSGKKYSSFVEYPKGEPENPVTGGELKEKFDSLMTAADVSEERKEEIYRRIMECGK